MAFSFRQIISNIPYFKKPDDEDFNGGAEQASAPAAVKRRHTSSNEASDSSKDSSNDDVQEKTPNEKSLPVQIATNECLLSDSDLYKTDHFSVDKKANRTSKKLKLNIEKALNGSSSETLSRDGGSNSEKLSVENTPTQVTLQGRSAEIFSERLKEFDLSRSFDIFDLQNDDKLSDPNFDIQSLSEQSDSDASVDSHENIQMCRKARSDGSSCDSHPRNRLVHSSSVESFGDVELDRNEEERISLLISYQMKFEKLERLLQKLLKEFQFHIEVSKVFQAKSMVTTLPGTDVNNLPQKILGEITYMDNISRSTTPTGMWNIIIENEDKMTKFKLRKQLMSMKHFIQDFVNVYLNDDPIISHRPAVKASDPASRVKALANVVEVKQKRLRINKKKRDKRINDFPDWRDAFLNLFELDKEIRYSSLTMSEEIEMLNSSVDSDIEKCICKCRFHHHESPTQTDSGLLKTGEDKLNQSITSSIGNFTLDSTTVSAYSESLDNIISYNSFNDSGLYSTILKKAAIERITFYVQVHSILLKSDTADLDDDAKAKVTFDCRSCEINVENEHDLLTHILAPSHCERIHFLYKTAYIRRCISTQTEITPSTVLNPMTMYRDDNKIVCFGDSVYACSLCFKNLIVGESVLIAHCASPEHQERKSMLAEILE